MTPAHTWIGRATVGVVCLFATACVMATYSRLSHTVDEPTHLVAGLEWLQDHQYRFQTENPPLSRVVLALIPYYVGGARLPPADQRPDSFPPAIFYRSPDYIRNVTEARVATLVSFWLSLWLTWVLAGGRRDIWTATVATSMMALLPPMVAHSGFATTDVPFVAAFLAATWSYVRCLSSPTLSNAALFGLLAGLLVATKFSAFGFFPVVALALTATLWPCVQRDRGYVNRRGIMVRLVVAGSVLFATVWGCYGFRIGTLAELQAQAIAHGGTAATGWIVSARSWRVPAHEFVDGLLALRDHARSGHPSVLFGQFSARGFWFFYPVTFLAKTPLLFLAVVAVGWVGLWRAPDTQGRRVAVGLAFGGLGVLAVAAISSINLGIRHVLVVYPLLFISAAYGLARWSEASSSRRRSRVYAAAVVCLVGQAMVLASWVPNQIGYRNAAVRGEPGYVINDSDLDWGQDMLALQAYVRANNIQELYLLDRGTTNPCKHGFPPLKTLPLGRPVTGWLAVFERPYWLNRGPVRQNPCDLDATVQAPPGWLTWLRSYRPVAEVGTGVRVYHIEP